MEHTFELVRVDTTPRNRVPGALDIVEQFVIATGSAVMERDFQSFAECFALPLSVTTLGGDRTVLDLEELRSSFAKVGEHYRFQGVERMERTCLSATFIDDCTIQCVHETRLYRQNKLVQQPFQVRSVLRCIDGEWKICDTDYSIEDSLRYTRALTE